jgi:hypothetical protein
LATTCESWARHGVRVVVVVGGVLHNADVHASWKYEPQKTGGSGRSKRRENRGCCGRGVSRAPMGAAAPSKASPKRKAKAVPPLQGRHAPRLGSSPSVNPAAMQNLLVLLVRHVTVKTLKSALCPSWKVGCSLACGRRERARRREGPWGSRLLRGTGAQDPASGLDLHAECVPAPPRAAPKRAKVLERNIRFTCPKTRLP